VLSLFLAPAAPPGALLHDIPQYRTKCDNYKPKERAGPAHANCVDHRHGKRGGTRSQPAAEVVGGCCGACFVRVGVDDHYSNGVHRSTDAGADDEKQDQWAGEGLVLYCTVQPKPI
jgi:hypothetical protein